MKKKLRKKLEQWLTLGEKAYHYRKDVMDASELSELEPLVVELQQIRSGKLTVEEDHIEQRLIELEALLKRCGGQFYPNPGWAENAEMLLVAAILAIGIRSFFFQPFKIPTNSMYPTYNGMTHAIYEDKADTPSGPMGIVRKLGLGTSNYTVTAGQGGEQTVGVLLLRQNPMTGALEFADSPNTAQGWTIASAEKAGRSFFVLPARHMEYYVGVNGEVSAFAVPADFNTRNLYADALFPDAAKSSDRRAFNDWQQEMLVRANFYPTNVTLANAPHNISGTPRLFMMGTGKKLEAEDTVLAFEILTGDMLFVDRVSYHFAPPKFGDPFVFRTGEIPGIMNDAGAVESYYIKRLAGEPGDTLSIQEPSLIRNGEVERSRMPFQKNADQEGDYEGYTLMPPRFNANTRVEIPKNSYYALGDNSDESRDSRDWGFVPEQSIVGKAIFIYYPFSHRWGVAK